MKIITGVFFQKRGFFGTNRPRTEDPVVIVEPEQLKNMFTGVILPEPIIPYTKRNLCVPEGYMFDSYGFAHIFQYQETDTSVSFVKKYERREFERHEEVINYNFTAKENGEWLGEWKGENRGDGYASCIIVSVSDQMFNVTRFFGAKLSNRL